MDQKFDKLRRISTLALPIATIASVGAFAVGETTTSSSAMSIIQAQITSLTSDAGVVIAGALGISVLFFGAKFLWTKFKSMSK